MTLSTFITSLLQAGSAATAAPRVLFASEKIGTVLTVVLFVFFGFISLLLYTNRRISRLERESRNR